jgi:hypothetical protein
MWVTLILFGLLLLASVGGATGRGVYDSRDPGYNLHLPESKPRPSADSLDPNRQTLGH